MKTHLFMVTYDGDAAWSPFCLLSLKKFLRGDFHKVAIVPPDHAASIQILKQDATFDVKYVAGWKPSYMHQMAVKLQADMWCGADPEDLILFWDSDMTLTREVGVEEWCKGGLPILTCQAYRRLVTAEGVSLTPWERPTRLALGLSNSDPAGDYECVRCPRLAYWASSLRGCRVFLTALHPEGLEKYVQSCWNVSEGWLPSNRLFGERPGKPCFSEFATLGAYCRWKEPARYSICDVDVNPPGDYQVSFHSATSETAPSRPWIYQGWSHAPPSHNDQAVWRKAGLIS